MKQLLVIGASTSKKSINVQLANYAASLVKDTELNVIDLNAFEMPIYSIDREEADGFPEPAKRFAEAVEESDGIVISLAEHNGTYTAAFKNVLDWSSRIFAGKLWQDTPMLVLSTSPGARGGATVIGLAMNHWPFMAGNIVANFSLPSFYDNFKDGAIADTDLNKQLLEEVAKLEGAI